MHLRKIELCGFKSFANRTEIAFNPGVTGIVGPNGCGKSNVVDAMKWVLGTLSPKSLRGDEMMDVIFKGGEGMGPAGFAEVSLTLDNSDKKLPIEFDEVSVTRRLYSSGESRYLINKAECRLKDVRELFYGTGIGTDNYAIIEQGKIDRLVMSNPSERRGVFEEAAGISRYRVKRRETSSKLDRVSQDLLRLGDVVREITRETRSIKAQAARAERCKQLQESLRIKKVQMALREYDQLAANLREIAAALDADQQTKYGIDASIAILRKTLQDSDAFLANMSREENESSAVLKEAEAQASELSRIIEGNNQRIEEISSQIERINLDREELSGRLEGVKGSIAEGKREQETNGSAIGNLEIQLEEVSAKLTCAVEECRSLAQNIDRKKSEIFALAQRHAQYRNERTQVSSTKEDLMRRRKRLDDRIQEVVNELAGGEQTAVASESIRNAVVGELDALAAHLKMEEESHRALRESLAQSDNVISVLKNTLNKLLSRRDLINEMEARLDGVGDGGKALLRQTDAAFPGILGTLSDFIDVAPEHLKMVEAALGEHATSLVAQDLSSALAAAEFIRKNNLPRVTILIKGLPPGDDPVGGTPADYVRAPEDFKGMIGRLFGSIRVVDTLADAGTALESGQTRTSFVSRDGDILRSDGSVSTGTSSGDNRVLSRKSELKTLSTELEQAQVEFDRRDRERASCMRMTSVSEEKMNVLRQQIYEKNIRKIEAERELEHILKRINVLREEDGYIRAEVTEVDTEIDSGTKNEARLEELIRGLDDLQESVKAEVARMTESLETYEATKAQLHQEETTHRVGLASAQQRRDEIVRRLAALVGEESAIEEKVREVADHHEKLSTRVTNLLLENKEKGDAFAEAEQRRVVLQKRIEEISSAIALERENGAMARQELDASVLSHSELERRLQDARMKENEARWKLESLKQKVRDDCGGEIEIVHAQTTISELADVATLAADVERLQAQIAAMGTVNMFAIERLKELEERHGFLKGQETDILTSKSQLEEMIRKIDHESDGLFDKTLQTVREHFSAIFRKAFGGGKAEIIVEPSRTEPDGTLVEGGIEIAVKPPGKELTNLTLLSGGEKSLTAISLIMALFKANPSPFCILDEADAALDEANVDKYIGLIHEFVKETQFVVITHNKRTMAMADILYGVTMERRGISKRVQVNLSSSGQLTELKKKSQEQVAEPLLAAAPA